ncbi:cytochrome c-type biogenesis protein CcmH [Loktanella sp. PT4BL]|jgi:cytochrome c-type biogenesis protein CcmH|uniref:c-type cytochrome biogenesis protein CcmI n=1 Tax=unclassified Loktanella TaxID=290910 RepID=UPI0006DC269B|nr:MULTISPECIES: c-type cytochrome biogenesis protein CcmI [unclassified Loktanella]KQB95588.1 cytochrome C biogenesis protein CycH [Loktanella sp. 1ANDIMAR09]KQI70903.1 cytochrome C biogenesis protein CycH [Loktanella sp. 5RATIMAR09]PXW67211.1 cytochrome c-type biogenesis protein CcmH [Loktanella sp. PT4BL]
MIWLFFVLLSLMALSLMVLPLRTKLQPSAVPEDTTPAVLLDQLKEVKRDLERNIISEVEAKAAEQEIKRRILMQARKSSSRSTTTNTGGRVGVILGAVFVPLFAVGYYMTMGSPEIEGLAFADRASERQEAAQIADLSSQLYDRLISDPDGGPSEGWMLLGQTYSRMGRFEDAAAAFKVVSERPEADSGVFSMLAEALIYAEQGVVTPAAEAAIDRAMSINPDNPASVYYKALALSQKGESSRGYELLIARLNTADGFYPWMESLLVEANRIGAEIGKPQLSLADFAPMVNAPGPTTEDVANAQEMSDDDRQAFILSMVARLANRLEEEPGDLDGWMRLGNAYSVLGQTGAAIAAYERAEALTANAGAEDPRTQAIDDALSRLRP